MNNFEEKTQFYVYANRPKQGWRLVHGNLHDEPSALVVAEDFRAQGMEVRVTRRDVTILSGS